MNNPFSASGQWLKGNLHAHSTESDGHLSPQDLIDHYARAGYDFLSITDHRKLTDPTALDSHGMTLIPGCELNGGAGELGQHYHVVAIGMRQVPETPEGLSVQEIIDLGLATSRFCFIAHPYWSSLTYKDLLGLRGHLGIEVYNAVCHHGIGRGDSGVHWDEVAARGELPLGFAVDDTHWEWPDGPIGRIMVKCNGRSAEEIMAAIERGLFYATNGPTIENLEIVDGVLRIATSPVREFRFISPMPGSGWTNLRPKQTDLHREFELTLRKDWTHLRVEIVDEAGHKAWTNYLKLG